MKIEKKAWPKLFEKIQSGEKKFDLRLADWKCAPGDVLVLKEWDPEKKEYTGRETKKTIKYVLKTKEVKFWAKDEIDKYGFQIISF